MDMVSAPLAFIDGLGAPEMVLIFVIVLVLFGGQKLPEFARGLGKSIREFKRAAAGVEEEFKRALEEDERKNNTPKIAAPTTVSTAASPESAGPDTPYPDHDEYGNEISSTTEHPPESAVAPTTPPAAIPPESMPTGEVTAAPLPPVEQPAPDATPEPDTKRPATTPAPAGTPPAPSGHSGVP
jgi:sec-independent protein translocase protein TatA